MPARPITDVKVIAGGTSTATTCRPWNNDRIEVRLNVTTANPEGEYALAWLPRSTVSTPPPATVPPTPPPVGFPWDDIYLPPVGTPIHARPVANAGRGAGFWTIDGSTLRPVS